MNTQEPFPDLYVRPSWKPSFEAALSFSVKNLLASYRMARGTEFYVEIDDAPPSVNAIQKSFINRKTGKAFVAPDKRVEPWRQLVAGRCWGKEFKPKGSVAAVIAIESPNWVTKEYKIRQRDIDNPIKALLDALQKALRFNDSCLWEVHSAKIFSRRNATHVWLFDLGDVVTAIGGPSLLPPT